MATEFDLAQTFYIDKDAVALADTCFITSVDLYFEDKPPVNNSQTGFAKPGASVYICPVDNDVPNLEAAYQQFARVEYDNIQTSGVAATPTTFRFDFPILVRTAQTYAILIRLDGGDRDFRLWWNKAGETIVGSTNTTQVSSGKVDGFFYSITNGKQLTALRNADLKFSLKIAKFNSLQETFKVQNTANEFLVYDPATASGNFKGGEYVWQNTAPSTGNLTIDSTSTTVIGVGTLFSSTLQSGDTFVLTDGTLGNSDVRKVVSIANNTHMTVDVTPSFTANSSVGRYLKTPVGVVYDSNGLVDRLVLEHSTANSTLYFTSNSYVHGVDSLASCKITAVENYEAAFLRPSFTIIAPAGSTSNIVFNVANTTYGRSEVNQLSAENGSIRYIDSYPAAFASRSNEVLNSATLFNNSKSFDVSLTFSSSNPYVSPYVKEENLDVFVSRYVINNDATNEHTTSGNATVRYITKRVVLADGQDAEDMRVYATAYKPANTDILVFAKLQNNVDPELFDDKGWTQLELVNDRSLLSNPYNRNDLIDLEYRIPYYHNTTAVSGTYQTTLGSSVIVGSGVTVNGSISSGDLVRISQPNFPNNHIISIVTSANTSTLTIADSISNTSMVATGLKVDKIVEKHSAFTNIQNSGIVRYYNDSLAAFDGYKVFAIKIVLLADTQYRVPHLANIRALAVSA